jgi:hypothetical protein
MAKKVLIKKISLNEIIDVFVDLYNKGVDYVDLVNVDEQEGKLSVIFTKEYMCKEMQESDDFELIQDSIESVEFDEEESKFSEDDINDLI